MVAHIDLAALRHNLSRVRQYAPDSRVMAAVKADAYGHGLLQVSGTLVSAGVDALGVACLEEAIPLREAGLDLPIVLLEGVLSGEEAAVAAECGLEMVVHAPWQWPLLESLSPQARPKLWIKLNTGMNRLGFAAAEAAALHAHVVAHPGWDLRGWLTHLASADETGNPATARQIECFGSALNGLPGGRSIANSAGLVAWPQARVDWVRPGLMLYGASPFADRRAADLGLRPVMRVHSRIIAIRDVAAGEGVGYGARWMARQATRIGILAAGYADGVPRGLPSGTPLLLHDRRVSLAGRISMDMLAIDLGGALQANVGDAVTLWGGDLPVEEIAAAAGTIAYELFCGLGGRARFEYAEGDT